MNCQELIEVSSGRVEIYLHLPEYEGQKLILVGGAITTYDLFENHFFEDSLCHLYKDGRILRYGRVIGSFADIEVLNIIDATCVHTDPPSVLISVGDPTNTAGG